MKAWNELSMAEKADIMKLAIEGGVYDLDAIRSGYNEYASGGKIHIKPSHRDRLTELKKRTGKTEAELYRTGSPATRKMITFARNARKWKHDLGGNLFSGKENHSQQMITTGGTGYIPEINIDIKKRLYDNVTPFGYNNPVERIASAVFLNKPSDKQEYAGNRDILDDLWATYLGIPRDKRHYDPVLTKSKYRPAKEKDTSTTYYSIPYSNEDKDYIIKEALWDNGETKQLVNPELGTFTVSQGRDNKGQYVSYYDNWNLNPFKGITNVGNKLTSFLGLDKIEDLSFGLGNPVEIYDRIYLDDYYGVPKEARGGNFLPEITVTGKKHKFGGNLYAGNNPNGQQMLFGPAYWQQQVQKPIFTEELAEFNRRKIEEDKQRRTKFQKWAETKGKEMAEKEAGDYTTASNDNTWVENNPTHKPKNPHLADRAQRGAEAHAAWEKENPILNTVGLGLSTIPFIAAASPILAPAGEAFAGTTLDGISAPMWTDAVLTAGFGTHGLDHAINEGIDGWGDAAMTALEITPLGRVARPMYKAGKATMAPIFSLSGKNTKDSAGKIVDSVVKKGTKPKQKDLVWDAEQMFKDGNNHNYTQEDVTTLNSYIPEYKEIERASKADGTYLKMPDGSTWKGDPREWVIAKSKNVQDNYGQEILTHGNSDSWITKGGEDITGDVLGKKVLWTSTNPHLGGTYGNSRYRFVIPKDADIQTVADAQGRFWREVKPGMDTNMLVYPNLTENNVIRINNVVDRGPNEFFYKEWPAPYPKEEVPDYYRRVFTGDDLILGENIRRKALLGNNGRFDINNPNIFKVLWPAGIGGTAYGISRE